MRRLVVSPAVWRHRVFTSFPSLHSASSTSLVSLPSLWDVVQIADMRSDRMSSRYRAPWSFASLPLFPKLRQLYSQHTAERQPVLGLTSLASLRHLTRISLHMTATLDVWKLQLLAALPVLVSFAAEHTSFEAGSEETLAEWQAVSASKRGTKRKDVAEEAEDGQEDEKTESAQSWAEQQTGTAQDGSEHDEAMRGEQQHDDMSNTTRSTLTIDCTKTQTTPACLSATARCCSSCTRSSPSPRSSISSC